jgi:hypothetical protein
MGREHMGHNIGHGKITTIGPMININPNRINARPIIIDKRKIKLSVPVQKRDRSAIEIKTGDRQVIHGQHKNHGIVHIIVRRINKIRITKSMHGEQIKRALKPIKMEEINVNIEHITKQTIDRPKKAVASGMKIPQTPPIIVPINHKINETNMLHKVHKNDKK